MTSPQDPWQSGPWQQGQYPQQGTPSGGFPQQSYPGQYPQSGYPQAGFPQQLAYPQAGYQQGNPYAAPPVSPHEMGGVRRPIAVEIAFWIAMVVPVVVTVLYAVYMLLIMQLLNDAINTSIGTGLDSEEFRNATEAAATGFMIVFGFLVFIAAVLTGLWILFGFKMRAGRNWARVTLTVFGSIWGLWAVFILVSGGFSFNSAGGAQQIQMPAGVVAISYLYSSLSLLAMIAFIILVYLKPSNWFFQLAGRR